MKKFTSLFALLAGLCVFSAQAEVTVHILSTDPGNHHLHWWNATEASCNYGSDPTIASLGTSEVEGGYTLFTKSFTLGENQERIGLMFYVGNGQDISNKTGDIFLEDGVEVYLNYSGGTGYSQTDDFEFNMYLSGNFNDWGNWSLTPVGNRMWMEEFWVPEGANNAMFKIHAETGEWYGFDQFIGSNNPYSFVFRYDGSYNGDPSDNNIIVNPIPNISPFVLVYKFNGPYYYSGTLSIYGKDLIISSNMDGIEDLEFITSYDLSNFKVGTVTYERTVTSEWGTLCLPFEFNAEDQYQYDVSFYSFSSISNEGDNQVLNLTPITGTVEAGTPIVFHFNAEDEDDYLFINACELSDEFVVPSVTLCNAPKNNTPFGDGYSLFGTFKNQSIESGLYFIKDDQFWYGSQGADFKPYRAWFTGPAPQSPAPFRISVDDTEGLQFVEQEDGTVKAYFDLQGRKLDGARKGLVIENGKIIMVK